ncbi:transporter [Neisseria flavescens]|uniref:Outer membrane protein transport protein, Ompp1/FadL/TodX family n=1 Tax=Neisseria flavescens NRL30031/H210 TaxID=546264 RepID=C0EKB8_NEIFL|nr:OmpP1/FadL family transporter [Neisseria flavescens]SPY01266.1 outer membrane protein P1 [Neisseria meningitidis]EEG34512.1 outer membrane protein transport protein, Ompp1/FadL/TodX family [Neisseria flavescens NRL30031/H210]QCL69667.1 transporter [Neisseria flavescens]SPY06508.1 outer membrane protein P1 [Neisseria meningitidis]STZ66243.1 outer membrane protein P1 [Neisseria flavescens]
MIHFNLKKTAFILSTALLSTAVHASGYHFGTQSVNAQSTANAAAAEAADASTIFYNPAGLTKLDSSQISVNANIVLPSIHYEADSATDFTGLPVQGSQNGKITKTTVAPHIYGAYKVNDDLTVGLGVYVPFGSATEYEKDSVLRHNINKLGLTSIAVEPVAAWKLNDHHSFGAGIIAQHTSAELRKYADWGIPQKAAMLKSNPAGAAAIQADGHADVKGSDWGFGYQLAWMWGINDRARVGVNYRSKVSHTLKGDAEWAADDAMAKQLWNSNMLAPLGYTPSEKARVKIVTPESLSVHGMYKVSDKTDLFGDVTWTRHSRFNKAELVFEKEKSIANGKKSDRTTITPNWRNTYKVGLGGSYQISEPLQLRAGIAFDKSPVRNADYRMNSLPDGNRIWFSVGAKYQLGKNHVIDAAYSHIHINDTVYRTGKASGNDVDSRGASSARFKNKADILGLQYTYKFK